MPKVSSITFAAIIAVAFAMPAQAGYDEGCQSTATFAESIMTIRQAGGPMGILLTSVQEGINKAATGQNEFDDAASKVAREIIILAYKEPRFSTPEMQQRKIGDFRDEMHVRCLSAAGGD